MTLGGTLPLKKSYKAQNELMLYLPKSVSRVLGPYSTFMCISSLMLNLILSVSIFILSTHSNLILPLLLMYISLKLTCKEGLLQLRPEWVNEWMIGLWPSLSLWQWMSSLLHDMLSWFRVLSESFCSSKNSFVPQRLNTHFLPSY